MWAVVPAPQAMCYVVQIEPVFGATAMEEFLEAIDQLVTADRVRELIRRYDLSQAMGDDLSDEGLPREYYLESKMHGVLIRYYEPRLVKTVYLYSGTKGGFSRFQGPLIAGITFQSYRDDVVRALGSPSRSANPGVVPFLGSHGGWDRYDRESYSIHFSYSASTTMLEMVTIMAPDRAARLGGLPRGR
jgi:hypothetical protein